MSPWDDEIEVSVMEVFGFDDLELDARCMWSAAKLRIVAARRGLDDETLAGRMIMMGDEARAAILAEMDAAPVDPRTGDGLH